MADESTAEAGQLSFSEQIRSFPAAFWVANIIELIERFSFFGVRMIAGLSVVVAAAKKSPGGDPAG